MSIMYEALQKTQPENDVQALLTSHNDLMTLDDWIDVAIALTIAMLLAAIMVAHYPRFTVAKTAALVSNTPILEAPDEAVVPKVQSIHVQQAVKPVAKNNIPVPVADEAEFKLSHVLNGVFVSDEEKVAMINNRFFNIGDTIDGMKIVAIEPNKIKLQSDRGTLELKIVV